MKYVKNQSLKSHAVKSGDRKMSGAIHTVHFSSEREVASVSQWAFHLLPSLEGCRGQPRVSGSGAGLALCLADNPCTFLISAQMSFLWEPSSHLVVGFLPPSSAHPVLDLIVLFYFLPSIHHC